MMIFLRKMTTGAGDMVLFPSWLVHKVLPNPKGVQRVAWVFNLAGTAESWLRTSA